MNLVSTTDRFYLTGALADHFDTFARYITIFKTPQKTITNSDSYAGYGESSAESSISTTVVSGQYLAMRVANNVDLDGNFDEVPVGTTKGEIYIKVQEDAMNFIENGANEAVLVDGLYYNFAGSVRPKNYLGYVFYIYPLEKVK